MSPLESWALICNLGAVVYLIGSALLRLADRSNDDA